MLIGGLWHGAGWTFIAWGGLHGAYLMVNHLFRRFHAGPPKQTVWSAWSGRILTLLAVMVAWVFSVGRFFKRVTHAAGNVRPSYRRTSSFRNPHDVMDRYSAGDRVVSPIAGRYFTVSTRFSWTNPLKPVCQATRLCRYPDRIKSNYGSAGPRDGNRQHSYFNRSRLSHPTLHLHDILTLWIK